MTSCRWNDGIDGEETARRPFDPRDHIHCIVAVWLCEFHVVDDSVLLFEVSCCTCFGSTYTKIGTIQRRLAWPLRKDDTQNREAFHIFWHRNSHLYIVIRHVYYIIVVSWVKIHNYILSHHNNAHSADCWGRLEFESRFRKREKGQEQGTLNRIEEICLQGLVS